MSLDRFDRAILQALQLDGRITNSLLAERVNLSESACLRRIRALPPARGGATPAAALTAYAGAQDRVRALQAGFQMHLAKPIDTSELAIVVAGLTRPLAHDQQ